MKKNTAPLLLTVLFFTTNTFSLSSNPDQLTKKQKIQLHETNVNNTTANYTGHAIRNKTEELLLRQRFTSLQMETNKRLVETLEIGAKKISEHPILFCCALIPVVLWWGICETYNNIKTTMFGTTDNKNK